MATGTGKTYTAVNFIYRLGKYGGAKRVLFLVDRGNLGARQGTGAISWLRPGGNWRLGVSAQTEGP